MEPGKRKWCELFEDYIYEEEIEDFCSDCDECDEEEEGGIEIEIRRY